jgi:hypothetical protein
MSPGARPLHYIHQYDGGHLTLLLLMAVTQVRNLAAALLLSHGVPMFVMGDEYGHSKVSVSGTKFCSRWGCLHKLQHVHSVGQWTPIGHGRLLLTFI